MKTNILLGLLLAAGLEAQTGRAGLLSQFSAELEDLSSRVSPAVVEVLASGYGLSLDTGQFSRERRGGSGVILSADGYIITNAHVIAGASRVQIIRTIPRRQLPGKSILKPRTSPISAEIVAVDRSTDLALLKIDRENLPHLTLADSEAVRQGQVVVAFGSPHGLEDTMTMGVVSASVRQLIPGDDMIYIQTDTPINPGNSGGPLVDIEGRVVGINTMISSQSGGSEGIGFAVPGNIVATVFDQLRRLGRVVRGEIGVAGQTVTPGLAKGLGLATQTGVIISDVALGSTAGLAGLKPDDIVISLDGKPMENLRQLKVNLYRKTGDVATLEVLRGSENLKLRVIVKEKASDTGRLASLVNPSEHLVQEIGVFAIPAQDPRLGEVKTRPGEGGLVVAGMAAGRSPDESSPVPGDVIYAVNRQRVSTVAELRSALDELGHGPAVLRVERGGVLLYLEVELD